MIKVSELSKNAKVVWTWPVQGSFWQQDVRNIDFLWWQNKQSSDNWWAIARAWSMFNWMDIWQNKQFKEDLQTFATPAMSFATWLSDVWRWMFKWVEEAWMKFGEMVSWKKMSDEQKQEYLRSNDQFLQQSVWDNSKNIISDISREWWRIAWSSAMLPWLWTIKGIWTAWKVAYWLAKWTTEWMIYNRSAWQDNAWTALIWWAIEWAMPLLWKAYKYWKWLIKWIAPSLELSWMLNPAKLLKVKEKLIEEWAETVWKWEVADVWKWMIERGMKWSKEEIISKLEQHSKDSKWMVDKILASSKSTHETPVAKKALEKILDDVKSVPWLEAKAQNIENLLSKNSYTLSELNQIKRELDDTYNMYTKAWGETAWLKSEWLRNIRKELKTFIEKQSTTEWLWNIKMLNNETQIAKELSDAITRKESADVAREMLSVFWKWFLGWTTTTVMGPFDTNTTTWKIGNFLIWAVLWPIAFSTTAKTYLAWALKWLSWIEKKELNRYIQTKGKEVLSEKTLNTITKISNEVSDIAKKEPAPYNLKWEPITPEYKPNFKEYEAPKALPKPNEPIVWNLTKKPNKAVKTTPKTDVSSKKTTKQSPLHEEAKKYKSAEEFVNSKERIYHWTKDNIKTEDLKWNVWVWWDDIVSYTDNKIMAKKYAEKKWWDTILNWVISDNANIFETDMDTAWIELRKLWLKSYKEYWNYLKSKWYDWIKVDMWQKWKNYFIFDPKKIKTESQLKQIREEANKK